MTHHYLAMSHTDTAQSLQWLLPTETCGWWRTSSHCCQL